jgi:hypothetical protein
MVAGRRPNYPSRLRSRRKARRKFDLESKQLELLREVVPKAAVIGVLVNPTVAAAQSQESEAQVAARALWAAAICCERWQRT